MAQATGLYQPDMSYSAFCLEMNEMVNPQKENGYTAIANELMEALSGIRISGEARQCLDSIFRKTYGWHKKEDQISLSQFCLLTKMSKVAVRKAIVKLGVMNLIITKKGNEKGNYYSFNKHFDTWKPLPKKVSVTKKGKRALPKTRTTKETTTKDKGARTRAHKKMINDYEEEVIDADTGEIRRELKKAKPLVITLIRWGEVRLGRNFANLGKQAKSISQMGRAGYTAEQVKECWLNLEADKFWDEKGIDFGVVASQIAKQKEVKYNPMLYEPSSRN